MPSVTVERVFSIDIKELIYSSKSVESLHFLEGVTLPNKDAAKGLLSINEFGTSMNQIKNSISLELLKDKTPKDPIYNIILATVDGQKMVSVIGLTREALDAVLDSQPNEVPHRFFETSDKLMESLKYIMKGEEEKYCTLDLMKMGENAVLGVLDGMGLKDFSSNEEDESGNTKKFMHKQLDLGNPNTTFKELIKNPAFLSGIAFFHEEPEKFINSLRPLIDLTIANILEDQHNYSNSEISLAEIFSKPDVIQEVQRLNNILKDTKMYLNNKTTH